MVSWFAGSGSDLSNHVKGARDEPPINTQTEVVLKGPRSGPYLIDLADGFVA
jgi:hypothetical protein